MRSPPCAISTICATVAGRRSTPAWASPAADPVDHVTDAVLEGHLDRAERLESQVEPAGVEVADVGEDLGAGYQEPRAVRQDEGESAALDHALGDVGADGAGRLDLEEGLERAAGSSTSAAQTGHQPVDRQHRQLVVDQLDHVDEHRLAPPGAGGVARVALLVAVGERRLVAVVAVGDDDRRGRRPRR